MQKPNLIWKKHKKKFEKNIGDVVTRCSLFFDYTIRKEPFGMYLVYHKQNLAGAASTLRAAKELATKHFQSLEFNQL